MLPYQIEHLFTYRAVLAAPEVVGPSPNDLRINFPLTGGEVWGARLQGKVRPGGMDYATLRNDGVIIADVRGLLESNDGALIDIAYSGVLDLGPDGYANFIKGQLPAELKIRATPRFRTAHPNYQWLNRLQCFSIGLADLGAQQVTYDVYALH